MYIKYCKIYKKVIGNRFFPILMYSCLDDFLLNHLNIPQHNIQKLGASMYLRYIQLFLM